MKKIAILLISISAVLIPGLTVYLIIAPAHFPSDAPVTFYVGSKKGCFTALNSRSVFDAGNLTASKIDCAIPVKTIFTGRQPIDQHLLQSDWFDAVHYPDIAFKSIRIQQQNDLYLADGYLTLRGVTQRICLPFYTRSSKNGATILAANLRINPQSFGFGTNMNKEVMVALSIPANDLSLASAMGSSRFMGNGAQSLF